MVFEILCIFFEGAVQNHGSYQNNNITIVDQHNVLWNVKTIMVTGEYIGTESRSGNIVLMAKE
jgi:hypothetical protein